MWKCVVKVFFIHQLNLFHYGILKWFWPFNYFSGIDKSLTLFNNKHRLATKRINLHLKVKSNYWICVCGWWWIILNPFCIETFTLQSSQRRKPIKSWKLTINYRSWILRQHKLFPSTIYSLHYAPHIRFISEQ